MAQEWKIRSMDESDSRSAVAAAERAKVTTAVWVGAAIREKIAREREGMAGEVIEPESAPANGVGPTDRRLLIDILATGQAPQWLRSNVARQLGALIGAVPPAPPPRPRQRAIAAPREDDAA
jgi:hypothetical protein